MRPVKPFKPIPRPKQVFHETWNSCTVQDLVNVAHQYNVPYCSMDIEVGGDDYNGYNISATVRVPESPEEYTERIRIYEKEMETYKSLIKLDKISKQQLIEILTPEQRKLIGI